MDPTRRRLCALLGALPILCACSGDSAEVPAVSAGEPKELAVYAAASLKDALAELNAIFEREEHAEVLLNAGSSGTLSVQIEQGGACDVFFSAGEREMDRLAGQGLVDQRSRRSLLSNQLVLVVPRGSGAFREPADLKGEVLKHLSLANVESVPAGRYAKEWLEQAGLWAEVAPKVLPAVDVRAALAQVEFGGAEAGIVYRTDAAIAKELEIAYAVPLDERPKISYPLALMQGRPEETLARRYVEFLASERAREVFTRYGFLVNDAG
jgi:molybdate transport system substrate-binding protein